MRGQRIDTSGAFGNDAYAARPECISVLAPLLGLDSGTSPDETKAAIRKLLEQANTRELPRGVKDAALLVSLAIAAEPGTFDFNQEVRPVSFKGDLRTVSEVKRALTELRNALSSQTIIEVVQNSQPAAHNSFDEVATPVLPRQGLAHIGELIPQALERPVDKRVQAFEKALHYLQTNGIVAPGADESRQPSFEVTQKLERYRMVWKWNSKTQSWDPKLNRSRNQSLFTAAPKYLDTIRIKGDEDRDTFIRSICNARSVEDNPQYRANQSLTNKLLIHDLIACATRTLGREVSLPTVMRLQALYRFLNPTPPPSTD